MELTGRARATLMCLVIGVLLAACSTTSGKPSTASSSSESSTSALAQVQADLGAALAATTWPKLSPGFVHVADPNNKGCTVDNVKPTAQCTWGNASAPHTFFLVGDSTSAAYLPAFASFIDQIPTWKMVVRSDSGCPFSTMPAPEGNGLDPDAGSAACAAHDEKVVNEINSLHPDLVVFTSVSGAAPRIPGKQAELAAIEKSVGKIVVLPTTPPLTDPAKCDTPTSAPADCITPLPKPYGTWLKNFKAVALAVHGTFIDPTELFCADGSCPAFVRTIPKTADGIHTTVDYAKYLGPAIHELFQQNNLLP
jgi:hypothetical protein